MNHRQRLYQKMLMFVQYLTPDWRLTQQRNLAYACRGVLEKQSLVLSQIARTFPGCWQPKANQCKHPLWHKLKRLRRFLTNPRLKMRCLFRTLTFLALGISTQPDPKLSLLVDLTFVAGFAILNIGIPQGGRTLPVVWHTFRRKQEETSENIEIEDTLTQAFELLPSPTTLVADRGFASVRRFEWLQQQKRDFVIRVKKDTGIRHKEHTGVLGALELKRDGVFHWFEDAYYTQEGEVRLNVLAVWGKGFEEPWYLATSLDDPQEVFDEYRSRMKVEHQFRDWKHHLRIKHTLQTDNLEMVQGLVHVLCVLYWFVALFGLRWEQQGLQGIVGCWGNSSFFKLAFEILLSQEQARRVAYTWRSVHAYLRDKLWCWLRKPIRTG